MCNPYLSSNLCTIPTSVLTYVFSHFSWSEKFLRETFEKLALQSVRKILSRVHVINHFEKFGRKSSQFFSSVQFKNSLFITKLQLN